jgi:excisionase family DNA binding protein
MSIMPHINFDAISVSTAATLIGCTNSYVRRLCREGQIRSQKLGERAWVVSRVDAEKMAETPQSTGRPRKSSQK